MARPRISPRSLYVVLAELAVALLLLPVLLIGIAWIYERVSIGRHERELERLAQVAEGLADPAVGGLAAGEHMVISVLDPEGVPLSAPVAARQDAPLSRSVVGSLGERIVGIRDTELQTVARADALLPAWSERDEVQRAQAGQRAFGRHVTPDGAALLVTLAVPRPGGRVLYLVTGDHRGVRRLALARAQLIELVIYELVLALPLIALFAVTLVRPLEQLAVAARHYPAKPLVAPELAARRDEIGALARTLGQMAEDLEARRKQAVGLGADIAHEFKNPLATIGASAELLASTKTLSPERVTLIATTVAGAVERLRRSIDDLLALTRLEDAVPREPREPVRYGPFLESLAAEYAADPRAAGWTVAVAIEPSAAEVEPPLNRRRWTELLRNLIDNALVLPVAEPNDRRITLGARLEPGALTTTVTDRGPGISAENQARIFDRFFTQRPAGAPPGTGLGLSIVQAIAEAHGARVEVKSEVGAGAEFRVVLPVA